MCVLTACSVSRCFKHRHLVARKTEKPLLYKVYTSRWRDTDYKGEKQLKKMVWNCDFKKINRILYIYIYIYIYMNINECGRELLGKDSFQFEVREDLSERGPPG